MQKLVGFGADTWEPKWRRIDRKQRQMRGKRTKRKFFEEWYTAGLSSQWGRRSWQHLRSRSHQFLCLSSSLSSPPGGTSSSFVSPALTGWSLGIHRWAWSLRHWLFGSHLEEIIIYYIIYIYTVYIVNKSQNAMELKVFLGGIKSMHLFNGSPVKRCLWTKGFNSMCIHQKVSLIIHFFL